MEQEQGGETIFSFSAVNEEIGEAVFSESGLIMDKLLELIDSGWMEAATRSEINNRVAEIVEPHSEAAKQAALASCDSESFALLDIGDGDEDVELARCYRAFADALGQLVDRDSSHPEIVDWQGPPDYLDDIANQLRAGSRQWRRFKTILAAFGYSRRRQTVVDEINRKLEAKGLRTKPAITTDLPLKSSVVFSLADPRTGRLAQELGTDPSEPEAEPDRVEEVGELEDEEEDLRTVIDISITVGNLTAASRQPECLSPDATIEEAMTVMDLHDYSQIVVSTGKRSVKGVVSYRSIARAQRDGEVTKVQDCMETDFQRKYIDTPLLEVVRIFHEHEVVVIFNRDETLAGLVTPADIAEEFGGMAEPFFVIGEIENLFRWLIRKRKLDIDGLLLSSKEEPSLPDSVDFLTLGEVERMIQSEEGWSQLSVPYDRKVVAKALRAVRESRNEVMHFRDTLTSTQLQQLRDFLQLLRDMCTGVESEGPKAP